MKKLVVFLLTLLISVPVMAHNYDFDSVDPQVLDAIDVDTLSEDELKEAYSELRKTYSALYTVYVDSMIANDNAGANDESSLQPASSLGKTVWSYGNYVDEFNEPTGERFISPADFITGTFSNAAVTDHDGLKVDILVDKDKAAIKLYEYNDSLVKNSYSSSQKYDIIIKDPDGNKHDYTGTMYSGGTRIVIDPYGRFIETLKKYSDQGGLMFIIKEHDHPTTNYKFTMPQCFEFENLYNEIK